jgi:hypothetical protein
MTELSGLNPTEQIYLYRQQHVIVPIQAATGKFYCAYDLVPLVAGIKRLWRHDMTFVHELSKQEASINWP